MDLRELEYITEIAAQENLTAAAKNLEVSQAALSQYLTNTEKELGITLFLREKNRLKITEQGKLYAKTAQKMLAEKDKLYQQLQKLNTTPKIRIGLASSYSIRIFGQVIAHEKKIFSQTSFSVTEGRALNLINQLKRGMLDFAILARDQVFSSPDYVVHIIRKEPFALFLSPDHPMIKDLNVAVPVGQAPPIVDFSIFNNESFVLSPKETSDGIVSRNILDRYCPKCHVFCSINDTSSLMALTRQQIGLTIMPVTAFFSTPSCHDLYWCIPQEPFYRYLMLIYRQEHIPSETESALIRLIQQSYDDEHAEKLLSPQN